METLFAFWFMGVLGGSLINTISAIVDADLGRPKANGIFIDSSNTPRAVINKWFRVQALILLWPISLPTLIVRRYIKDEW